MYSKNYVLPDFLSSHSQAVHSSKSIINSARITIQDTTPQKSPPKITSPGISKSPLRVKRRGGKALVGVGGSPSGTLGSISKVNSSVRRHGSVPNLKEYAKINLPQLMGMINTPSQGIFNGRRGSVGGPAE